MQLDHLILTVKDRNESIEFFTKILGLNHEGENDPFSVIRVTPEMVLLLAPWGTKGGEHLAFSMARSEFDQVFKRIRDAGIEYGDTFHEVGNMRGPRDEPGARGMGKSLYVFDPNRHLIEIRYYQGQPD